MPEARARTIILNAVGDTLDELHLNRAVALTDDIIAALSAAGMKVLTREFDTGDVKLIEAIIGGGCEGFDKKPLPHLVQQARRRWHEIFAAFPTPTLPPAGDET